MKNKQIIYKMLTENTGTHFLDSGFANDRMWQKNQIKTIKDFEDEEVERYELHKWKDNYELNRTLSVYHYLKDLETNEICDEFNRIQDNFDNWDADCEAYGISYEAWEYLNNNFEVDIDRIFNTYNGNSDLSQVLQGANIRIFDNHYIILQIHNGADVRGGYTDAKLFKLSDEGLIHEYLREYIDSYELSEELEHIEKVWYDDELIDFTNELKEKVQNEIA